MVQEMAKEDHESVIALTRDLVAIPRRGGIDPYEPVLDWIGGWFARAPPAPPPIDRHADPQPACGGRGAIAPVSAGD